MPSRSDSNSAPFRCDGLFLGQAFFFRTGIGYTRKMGNFWPVRANFPFARFGVRIHQRILRSSRLLWKVEIAQEDDSLHPRSR